MYNPNRSMWKNWVFYLLIRRDFIIIQICFWWLAAIDWFVNRVKFYIYNKDIWKEKK